MQPDLPKQRQFITFLKAIFSNSIDIVNIPPMLRLKNAQFRVTRVLLQTAAVVSLREAFFVFTSSSSGVREERLLTCDWQKLFLEIGHAVDSPDFLYKGRHGLSLFQ